jgi:hypothetical protein
VYNCHGHLFASIEWNFDWWNFVTNGAYFPHSRVYDRNGKHVANIQHRPADGTLITITDPFGAPVLSLVDRHNIVRWWGIWPFNIRTRMSMVVEHRTFLERPAREARFVALVFADYMAGGAARRLGPFFHMILWILVLCCCCGCCGGCCFHRTRHFRTRAYTGPQVYPEETVPIIVEEEPAQGFFCCTRASPQFPGEGGARPGYPPPMGRDPYSTGWK